MKRTFRNLNENEISKLESQFCLSDNWSQVLVDQDFKTDNIFHSRFSGNIKLGVFEKEITLEGGLVKHSGLRHVTLHNCEVGNNVLIENVPNYIANYKIGDETFIQNVNLIVVEGKSRFGNGTEVSVLNETGGREVPIYDKLSAHLAYIIALYRHHPLLIDTLRKLIEKYADDNASEMGYIGSGCSIINTGTIKNTRIGDCCRIDGASRLKNGSINSNSNAPVYVGHNVIAENFIFSSGSSISDGAVVMRCFVGQACHLSHLFSAHDSLFFCNCHGENGEACAIFAGPYTVSMHKSSLLIAGMFSFLNAGSGSNQSNHMYKLGPIHQGIVERGSKTTSDSYILWPAKIGAFSLVMGRHVNHPDTSKLPFSYLIEKGSTSYIVPGVNLKSVGTIRDALKWPKRDERKDSEKLDYVNFNLLSPYTIEKMLIAIGELKKLQACSGETSEAYSYQSACIRNSSLNKGIVLYSKAINKFLGNSIIKRLENISFASNQEIQNRLRPETTIGSGEWIDLSGLIAPKSEIEKLIFDIENENIVSLEKINQYFESLHNNYYNLEWTWAFENMLSWYKLDIDKITADDIIRIVETWKDAVISLDKMLYDDAQKEFSLISKTGFGADGDSLEKDIDFEQVRGDFEDNPFVKTVKEHIQTKTVLGNELISRLSSLRTGK